MVKIKFGTDGWRAIIAREYTVDNVARVAEGTALWLKQNSESPKVVIGYDCRFGGKLFSETTAKVLCSHDITVILAHDFVSTPMVSLAALETGSDLGVVITASHNPPSYNGYKLKSKFGGPSSPQTIEEVENLIPETANVPEETIDSLVERGLIEYVDMETMYLKRVESFFDLESIKNAGIKVAYDAMFGAGQRIFKRILPDAIVLHDDFNPWFHGQAPEPLDKNLQELANLIKNDDTIHCGLATDGDADRIGMYNEQGKFVDAHHIILLLIHYLSQYKKMTGKVVVAFSTSQKIKKLCKAYGLDYEVTKIGFKYICGRMLVEDVLVGGEESGGIAVKGHIPERDGIWDGLVLLEFMAKTGKTLTELIDEVYRVVGAFSYNRNDLHLEESQKQAIIQNCKNGKYNAFGHFEVQRVEDLDGFKYFLGNDMTVMIRPSGTEPVLRIYAEAPDMETVQQILNAVNDTLLG
jgi:phosphomannomutase